MNETLSRNIKILSFVMTCVMVFYHCVEIENTYAIGVIDSNINGVLSYLFHIMGAIGMSFFFALTGFLLFKNFSIKDYPKKIKKRIFSLLIPYVIWQLIFWIPAFIVKKGEFSVLNFIKRTFLLAGAPPDGPLWYVYAVFLLAVLSPLLLVILKNKKIGWVIILIIIFFIEATTYIKNPTFVKILNYGYIPNILNYVPCYVVGAFYGKYYEEDKKAESLIYIVSLLLVAFVLGSVFKNAFESLTFKMIPLVLLIVLPALPKLDNKKIYALSFLMYAIHKPIISVVWRIFNKFFIKISLPISVGNLLIRCITIAIVILVAALIHFVLKKISPKFLGLLTGGRY